MKQFTPLSKENYNKKSNSLHYSKKIKIQNIIHFAIQKKALLFKMQFTPFSNEITI